MQAMFDGQDYFIFLDKRTSDLQSLVAGRKIEAPLMDYRDGSDLGKVVNLEMAENDGSDGIQLRYLPDDSPDFESIKVVDIKFDVRAYHFVQQRGKFGTRYNGSDKIEIVNGERV